MSNARPKSTPQVRAIYGLSRQHGIDNEALHELVASVLITHHSSLITEPVSIAKLTYTEAERVIERLKGKSFVPRRTCNTAAPGRSQASGAGKSVEVDCRPGIAAPLVCGITGEVLQTAVRPSSPAHD